MPVSAAAANNSNLVCSIIAILILLLRSYVSRNADHVTPLSKWLCIISILVCVARIPVALHLLQDDAGDKGPDPAQAKEVAILILVARCLSTTFLWLQITLLQRFYARVVDHIQWTRKAITITWITIVTTYTTCILATFLECRPLHLYWQIENRPQCTLAYVQLFLQGACNILLDIMLLVIAFPIVLRRSLNRKQIIQVAVLMVIGTFCIIVTGIKLAYIVGENSSQAARTFWASVQVAVSAFVANAPTIHGCLRLQRQKPVYQHHSTMETTYSNRKSIRTVNEEELELGHSYRSTEVTSFTSVGDAELNSKQPSRERSWLEDKPS